MMSCFSAKNILLPVLSLVSSFNLEVRERKKKSIRESKGLSFCITSSITYQGVCWPYPLRTENVLSMTCLYNLIYRSLDDLILELFRLYLLQGTKMQESPM